MRIPKRYLPHRVTLRPVLEVGGSSGAKYGPDRPGVAALVVDKRTKVRDQRESSSTQGEEIIASTIIVMRKEEWIRPDSLVVIWAGTPMERTVTVVSASYYDHNIAPNSAQMAVV